MRQGWEYKKFVDCLETAPKAKQVQTSEYGVGSKYPIVSQEDKLVSGYCDDASLLCHFDKPVVIFGDHTRVLKYVDFDFVVGADGVKILIPKDFLQAKTLLYYLQWYNIPSLGYSRHYKLLKELSIPIPSLSEQQSIIAELDKINELISLKKSQLNDLDALAQSIFYDMFGDPVVNEKGWEIKKLGEVFEIGTGSTPERKKSDRYYGGRVCWVKTTEVHNCDIYETEEKITDIALEETNCSIYPIDTILMAMYGQGKTRGQIARLRTEAATNQACAAILPNRSVCNVDYLYQFLHVSYEHIREIGRGGTQPNMNLSLVKSIRFPHPPLPLQQSFATKVEKIEAEKQHVKQSLKDLETLLASRMQYWFDN